jgi:plasmid maintenance system antidote protein VapI
MEERNMKTNGVITDMRQVPAEVRLLTFYFGRTQTNWKGIQKHYNLSDEITNSLRKDNEAYRSIA